MKMPAQSKLDAAERIRSIDQDAIEEIRAAGHQFTVPEFCQRWLEIEACKLR